MYDLEKIKAFAQAVHAGNGDGHGFDHIERVVALAQRILADEPSADANLVLAACYLHDCYDEKLCEDIPGQKARITELLGNAEPLFEIIDKMSFSANLSEKQTLSLEGQILQDADRLDAIGAWGIARALEYGFAKNREIYNPSEKPLNFSDKAAYHQNKGTTINHFYEKLFLISDLLNTPTAKKLAQPRQKIMQDFVRAIEQEYSESH